jgi:hypothetical protein
MEPSGGPDAVGGRALARSGEAGWLHQGDRGEKGNQVGGRKRSGLGWEMGFIATSKAAARPACDHTRNERAAA